MTQATALIVHEIMDAPEHWSDAGDHITNGYYKVAINGTFYTMGSAKYQADQADSESLRKAIDVWKEDTGWQPSVAQEAPKKDEPRAPITMSEFKRQVYEEFVRSARSGLKSFSVHKDSAILSSKIQTALDVLDGALRPMEKIEGKNNNAQGSGVHST